MGNLKLNELRVNERCELSDLLPGTLMHENNKTISCRPINASADGHDTWLSTNHRGFSLIELMVVISIVSVLTAFSLPHYHAFKIRTARAETYQVLKTFHSVVSGYHAENGSYGQAGASDFFLGQVGGTSFCNSNFLAFGLANCSMARYFYFFSPGGVALPGGYMSTAANRQTIYMFRAISAGFYDGEYDVIIGNPTVSSKVCEDAKFQDGFVMTQTGVIEPHPSDSSNNYNALDKCK